PPGTLSVRQPARRPHQPGGCLEDFVGLWPKSRFAGAAYAAYVATQLCHPLAGTRSGLALSAINAGPLGHFDHADLYPCGRGAVETDLQGAPSARIAWPVQVQKCRHGSTEIAKEPA